MKKYLFFAVIAAIVFSSCSSARNTERVLPRIIGVAKNVCANSEKAKTNGEKRKKRHNEYN